MVKGLKIMQLEKERVCHPVVRFDMSGAGTTAEELTSCFEYTFVLYSRII